MVEPQIVVLDVAGSSPVGHPIFFSSELPINVPLVAPEAYAPKDKRPQKAPGHAGPAAAAREEGVEPKLDEEDANERLQKVAEQRICPKHVERPSPGLDPPHVNGPIKREEAQCAEAGGE